VKDIEEDDVLRYEFLQQNKKHCDEVGFLLSGEDGLTHVFGYAYTLLMRPRLDGGLLLR
jgi:hypothetical protein